VENQSRERRWLHGGRGLVLVEMAECSPGAATQARTRQGRTTALLRRPRSIAHLNGEEHDRSNVTDITHDRPVAQLIHHRHVGEEASASRHGATRIERDAVDEPTRAVVVLTEDGSSRQRRTRYDTRQVPLSANPGIDLQLWVLPSPPRLHRANRATPAIPFLGRYWEVRASKGTDYVQILRDRSGFKDPLGKGRSNTILP